MSFIPIPNAIKATLEFTWAGQSVALTLGWKKASAVEETDLEYLAGDLIDWHYNSLKPLMADVITLDSINTTDLTSDSGMSINSPVSPPQAGLITGGSVENNVAPVVTMNTANRGRSYRGRNYFPGAPLAELINSVQLSSSWLADLLSAYTDLADVETAHGLDHVILSRFHNNVPRTTGVATPVTGFYIDPYVDSQRRRLAGRGI